MLPRSRSEAIVKGAPRYHTGRPCKNGHLAPRLLSSGTCTVCHNQAVSRWQKENKSACREKQNRHRRKRLGIPEATRAVPQVCENCDQPFAHSPNIDHDHSTGAFRGWLCRRCNVGIGLLGDSVEGLERAIRYLKRNA